MNMFVGTVATSFPAPTLPTFGATCCLIHKQVELLKSNKYRHDHLTARID